ncbi:MAG: hypothetical protein AAF732_00155 [Pseudomonadota bacterium]
MTVTQLASARLPADFGLRRDVRYVAPGVPDEELQAYDYDTLWYDAIYDPSVEKICIIGPPLYNLEKAVRRGQFSVDSGSRCKIQKIWRYKRFSEIWLPRAQTCEEITLNFEGLNVTSPVSLADLSSFRGLNAVATKSKNNDIHWISDWLTYHQKVHNLHGAVIFDNGSTVYDAEDLQQALNAHCPDLIIKVVSAPFLWGLHKYGRTEFFQTAMLNIARVRFFRTARAVLSCDIDELIEPIPDSDIFSRAVASTTGIAMFRGRWRYIQSDDHHDGPTSHADHIWRTTPAEDHHPLFKYCVANRRLGHWLRWDIHGPIFGRTKPVMRFCIHDDLAYVHCRAVSTFWRQRKREHAQDKLTVDKDWADLMRVVFG